MSEESEYPKWIDHPTKTRGMTADNKRIPERVLVKDEKEEAEVLGKSKSAKADKAADWGKN